MKVGVELPFIRWRGYQAHAPSDFPSFVQNIFVEGRFHSMKKHNVARRRGTSIAAAALSLALVAPFAQP
ncbi:hypothetical protein, partial [Corynebacterium sp. NML180780]|uniref:hypothetical protein n=1 Tax=Corynebacterium sp. NML180780 TaxID=2598459 RepID=UPI0011A0C219